MPQGSDKKNFKPYLRLLAYLRQYRGRVLLDGLCMVLLAGSTAFVMNQLTPIVNETFLKTDNPGETFHLLWTFTIPITLAAAILRALSGYGQDYFNRYLSQRVVQKLRNDLYQHFLKMPMAYFNAHRTGSLAARITSDVQRLQDSIINIVLQGASSFLMTATLAGLLIHLDLKLAFVALVVFPIAMFPIYRFGRKIRKASGEQQEILAELNSQIFETLGGSGW